MDEHIDRIERKKARHSNEVSFRDPLYFTHTYTFTLKSENGEFYHARPDQMDVYQIGYHNGLIYRNNCYQCIYARGERVGDMTLSDFSGLGKIAPYKGEKESVSCVVVSSERGQFIFNDLCDQQMITAEKRPADEAFGYDKMFQHPTIPHVKREKFKEIYTKTGNFEIAARKALRSELIQNRIKMALHIREARALASRIKHRLLNKGRI